MSRSETIRAEAERRGISHGKVWKERDAGTLINQMGGDVHIVYAWRWSDDDTCAKIGVSTVSGLKSRMAAAKTNHPTDKPVLIGVMKCDSPGEAKDNEEYFLRTLERTHPNREWVIIDEAFNQIIDEAFISPTQLKGELS